MAYDYEDDRGTLTMNDNKTSLNITVNVKYIDTIFVFSNNKFSITA